MTTVTSELTEIGDGIYAYVASSGTWGWSNAGLVTSGDSSMLVDTLFTVGLTREMLDEMRRATPAAESIDVLINSHADGDHTFGNQLLKGAQIVATDRAATDMSVGTTPDGMRALLGNTAHMGVAGEFLQKIFSPFDFSDVELVLPTTTFSGTFDLTVGDRPVNLIDLGPAHSSGDLIVHLPNERVVFVADLLFVGGHPAVWSGPISNWITACDRIIGLGVDVVVPGHGPLTDTAGVAEFRDYLIYVQDEAIRLHGLGRTVAQAAREIDLAPYASWTDAERIIVAMDTMYRELNGDDSPRDRIGLFAGMGELAFGGAHSH